MYHCNADGDVEVKLFYHCLLQVTCISCGPGFQVKDPPRSMVIYHCCLLCATECVLLTVYTINLANVFNHINSRRDVFRLITKILIKILHIKVLDLLSPNSKDFL